jgi:hypothetical protein
MFLEIHVFVQLSWIGLFGANRDYLHIENYDLQEVFLSKTNSILTEKHTTTHCTYWHTWYSLERYVYFFNSAKEANLEQTAPISTLKHLSCKKYSFQKLTQFSKENNALGDPATNIDGFVWRDMCVSSITLNSPFRSKQSLSCPWNTYMYEVFLSKTTSILKG